MLTNFASCAILAVSASAWGQGYGQDQHFGSNFNTGYDGFGANQNPVAYGAQANSYGRPEFGGYAQDSHLV